MSGHECEEWMLDDSAKGGKYCRACGKGQAPAEPADPGVFALGQRVTYSEHIRRRSAQPGEFLGPNKIWSNSLGPLYLEGHRWPGGEGVIVGKRTLSNGNTRWLGEDDGNGYEPTEHFTAYLVAYDLRRKPVHVLPEHITPELVNA